MFDEGNNDLDPNDHIDQYSYDHIIHGHLAYTPLTKFPYKQRNMNACIVKYFYGNDTFANAFSLILENYRSSIMIS